MTNKITGMYYNNKVTELSCEFIKEVGYNCSYKLENEGEKLVLSLFKGVMTVLESSVLPINHILAEGFFYGSDTIQFLKELDLRNLKVYL